MDLLHAAAGIKVQAEELEKGAADPVGALLVETARGFLEGGGALDLRDWSLLSPASRAAFIQAGRTLRVHLAATIAAGIQEGPAAAIAELDGGDLLAEAACEAAALKAAKSIQKRQRGQE